MSASATNLNLLQYSVQFNYTTNARQSRRCSLDQCGTVFYALKVAILFIKISIGLIAAYQPVMET